MEFSELRINAKWDLLVKGALGRRGYNGPQPVVLESYDILDRQGMPRARFVVLPPVVVGGLLLKAMVAFFGVRARLASRELGGAHETLKFIFLFHSTAALLAVVWRRNKKSG